MAKSDVKKSKKSVSKKQEEKATKVVQKKEESSSSSESSSSESSSSESESESEKEEKKEESSSDSDSSSDEEEEEEKKEESSSDSDSSSDEEEEKKKEESSSDSESSSESESEEESSKKRKAEDEEESATASEEPEAKKPKTEEAAEPATLFVGRLSWNIDDAWLLREFENYGGVLGARVISDRQTGRSKGYGYVDFESKEVAEKALAEMQGAEIDGRPINVDMSNAKPKPQDRQNDRSKRFGDAKSEPSDTLFIGNLSFDSDNNSVTEFFAEYGPVLGVRLPTHPETEQLKGFGYVQFPSVEAAKSALDNLNGEYLNNRPVRLDFSTPKPQGDRGNFGGNRGGRDRGNFGGNRGGNFGGNRGGFNRGGSGANSTPVGTKKTFD